MRAMPRMIAMLSLVALSVPAWAQSQYDQWAGWDSGRADRLSSQSVRGEGAAVRTIRAQPLRGDFHGDAAPSLRAVEPKHAVAVSRYPAEPQRYRDRSIAVNVGYRDDDGRSRFAVGFSGSSVSTTGYVNRSYYVHPGATYVHSYSTCAPRPLYVHPHPYAPRPALIYYRPACPPPVVYRPAYGYPCPPRSGFGFSFTYRN